MSNVAVSKIMVSLRAERHFDASAARNPKENSFGNSNHFDQPDSVHHANGCKMGTQVKRKSRNQSIK